MATTLTFLPRYSSASRARFGCSASENGHHDVTNARRTTEPRSDARLTFLPSWSTSSKLGAASPRCGLPISAVTAMLGIAGVESSGDDALVVAGELGALAQP